HNRLIGELVGDTKARRKGLLAKYTQRPLANATFLSSLDQGPVRAKRKLRCWMQLHASLHRFFTNNDDCAFAAAAAWIERAKRIILLLRGKVKLVSQSEIHRQFACDFDIVLHVHPVILHLFVKPAQRNVPSGAEWNIQQVVGKAAAGSRPG